LNLNSFEFEKFISELLELSPNRTKPPKKSRYINIIKLII